MTSDQHDHDPTDAIDDDPWDPVVAERFRLLDRATPPPATLPLSHQPAMATPDVTRDRARTPWVLAVAAAVVVVVGLSVLTLAGGDGGNDVEATDDQADLRSTERSAEEGGETDDDGTASSLEVEVRPTGAAEVDPSSTGDATTGEEDVARPGGVTTDVPEPSPSATASATTTTPTTATTTTQSPTTTTSRGSTSMSVSLIPEKETVQTITGTATEVFTDCASHLALDDQGKVVSLSPVSCDGGSWVKIDGTMVRTSSGFVAAPQGYDKHPHGLQPGQRVRAVALKTARGLTLECPQCTITVGA